MDRNELIEKVIQAMQKAPKPECDRVTAGYIADIIAELQERPDEWPRRGEIYWHLTSDDYLWDTWDAEEGDENRAMRGIYRTREEADLADRKRIARTAIHRWIEEKAEKVDWKDDSRVKFFPMLSVTGWEDQATYAWWIPNWFHVYREDYTQMMAENAAHFDVLKEGE